jgi:hypothetical protein
MVIFLISCSQINLPVKYPDNKHDYVICESILKNPKIISSFCNDSNVVDKTFIELFCKNDKRKSSIIDYINNEMNGSKFLVYDELSSKSHYVKLRNKDSTLFINFVFQNTNGKMLLFVILIGDKAEYEL